MYCRLILGLSGFISIGLGLSVSSSLAYDPPHLVVCPSDQYNSRELVEQILLRNDAALVDWKVSVGLIDKSPESLVLVTDEQVCTKLQRSLEDGLHADYFVTYFAIDGLYVIVESPIRDIAAGVYAIGRDFISVRDSRFRRVGSTLATQ
jgi:hypothetical protein